MDPFGHHNIHHRQEEYPPPPPLHHQQPGPPFTHEPPPPVVTSHHHSPPPPHYNTYGGGPSPPPPSHPHGYDSGPAYPPVQHVGHQSNNPPPPPVIHHETHHAPPQHGHNLPSVVHHESSGSKAPPNKPTVRVYTKAETNFSLTIRDGQVVLAPSNPRDDFQHWYKEEKWSTKVKDKENHPSFALVNKATGQAIKHSVGATQAVRLVPYKENSLDESILWSHSVDLGDSYRCIRMVNNIQLNLDAFNGDKEHGGVRNGTTAVLWEWKKGDNQRWKIAPH